MIDVSYKPDREEVIQCAQEGQFIHKETKRGLFIYGDLVEIHAWNSQTARYDFNGFVQCGGRMDIDVLCELVDAYREASKCPEPS